MLLLPDLTLLDDTTALRQASALRQAQGPRAQYSAQGPRAQEPVSKRETMASSGHSNRSDLQPGTSTTLRQAQCPAQ